MTSNPDRPTVETLLAHSDFVRGLARTLVSDPATADDAVQQAWLAAVESPPADGRSPRGWLTTVTRNAVRKTKRGEGRRDVREQAVARPERSVPSAAAIAEREEARRKLNGQVNTYQSANTAARVWQIIEDIKARKRLWPHIGYHRAVREHRQRRMQEQARKKSDCRSGAIVS